MLQYKLKDKAINPQSTTPIADYLRSLGITKVSSFLGTPDAADELNPFLLKNMDRIVNELHYGFTNNKKFFLQVDSDVDGMTSSSIFYRFFKGYYPNANIEWRIHEGKEHGVILSTVPEDADYVVLPDSGSMQLEEQQKLVECGKTVLIMDHHNVDNTIENDRIILVNNQTSPDFPNKALSGAGVVFKVIQAYAQTYPHMTVKYQDYYDLAALGILSDMMETRTLDNNYIIYHGLRNVKSELFKAILEKQAYSIKNVQQPTKIDTVFYVAPLINGVIRAGSAEEKELVFKAFIEEPIEDEIETTCRGRSRVETFYQYVARTAYNVKNRQNTVKEKCFNFLKEKINAEHLDKHKIIVVTTSKTDAVAVPQNITGLIATELVKEYNKPVLVLRPKQENQKMFYAGSGRGKTADGFESFLHFLKESQYTEYAEGHDMAFGFCVSAENLDAFIEETDAKLKDVDFGTDTIEVDAIFGWNNINHKMILEFAEYNFIYGNAIPQPKIAIEAPINRQDIVIMGKDSTSVRLKIGGLDCIKFKDPELVASLLCSGRGKVRLVGRPELNEWMGHKSGQLFIDAIEFTPIQVKQLF